MQSDRPYTHLSEVNLPPELTDALAKGRVTSAESLWIVINRSPDTVKKLFSIYNVDFDQTCEFLRQLLPENLRQELEQTQPPPFCSRQPDLAESFIDYVENLDILRIPGVMSCYDNTVDNGPGLLVYINDPSAADRVPATHMGKKIVFRLYMQRAFVTRYTYDVTALPDMPRQQQATELNRLSKEAAELIKKQHPEAGHPRILNYGILFTRTFDSGQGIFTVWSYNRLFLENLPNPYMGCTREAVSEAQM